MVDEVAAARTALEQSVGRLARAAPRAATWHSDLASGRVEWDEGWLSSATRRWWPMPLWRVNRATRKTATGSRYGTVTERAYVLDDDAGPAVSSAPSHRRRGDS